MDAYQFTKSYVVTNRSDPGASGYKNITPLPGDGLSYYEAPSPFETAASSYASCDSSTFWQDVQSDLELTGSPAQLTVYIHGMGNDWDIAVASTAAYALAIQQGSPMVAFKSGKTVFPPGSAPNPVPPSADCYYGGLVIGFSWPSFDGLDSDEHYCQSDLTEHTIRENIYQSRASFINLWIQIQSMATGMSGGLTVNVVCHSEGNYQMMLGMATSTLGCFLGQVVLLAADINDQALEVPSENMKVPGSAQGCGKGAGSGTGSTIASGSQQTTVLFSNNDTTLQDSSNLEHFNKCHVDDSNGDPTVRLGQSGPSDYGSLIANVNAIDCSAVVDKENLPDGHVITGGPLYEAGWIPRDEVDTDVAINPHGSYRYVPQILWSVSKILNGSALPFTDIWITGSSNPYTMKFDDPG